MKKIDLTKYDNSWYKNGRNLPTGVLWFFLNAILIQNRFNPSSKVKTILLRLFGSKIGKGVVLKPSLNVKYPWNLEIGDHSWIGEKTWLDSLSPIIIGKHVCISQGAYFCTGNHDWTDPCFGLIVKPIIVENGVWVGAQAVILPGVTLAAHSVVSAGSVVTKDTEPYMIYAGNPATKVKKREIK
jgi:putative colanic acid biosynthesis acetyltransferase WcaF